MPVCCLSGGSPDKKCYLAWAGASVADNHCVVSFMIRVVVLSRSYPREGDANAGIFVHQQLSHLREEGCEFIVVSPLPIMPRPIARTDRWRGYIQNARETWIDGIKVYYPRYLPFPGRRLHALMGYSLFLCVYRLVQRIAVEFEPQLLHAHWATPEGHAALLLKRRLSLPVLVTLRGSGINIYPHWNKASLRSTRRVLANADGLLAVSGSLRDAALVLERPTNGITVIHNGCETRQFKFNADARKSLRHTLGIAERDPVLIFIGGFVARKNGTAFVKVVRLLRDLHPNIAAIMVGNGPQRADLRSQVESASLSQTIHFVGAKSHDEIPAWLSAADILILPSRSEGLPNVVLEAMACQRPVVATQVGGVAEAVDNGKTGFLVPDTDVDDLVRATRSIVENPEMARAMGLEGRRVVESEFSWRQNARRVCKIYRDLLK